MGLVARVIEEAGISTLCLSNIPDLTQSVGIPRLVGIEYPLNRTLGKPGDSQGQRAVLRGMLAAAQDMKEVGQVEYLPFTWPETPAQARAGHSDPSPIEVYLKKRPWHIKRFIERDIPKQKE